MPEAFCYMLVVCRCLNISPTVIQCQERFADLCWSCSNHLVWGAGKIRAGSSC